MDNKEAHLFSSEPGRSSGGPVGLSPSVFSSTSADVTPHCFLHDVFPGFSLADFLTEDKTPAFFSLAKLAAAIEERLGG